MFKVISSVIATAILCASCAVFSQAQQPTNAVPFVGAIAPPSLALTSNGGFGSATLTITGANFPQNAVVKFSFGTNAIQPTSTTVNAAGSQITAQFNGNLPQSPLTFNVTVTNPNGTVPTVSNVVYLPQTPTTATVLLNRNSWIQGPNFPSAVVTADIQANGLPSLAVVSQAMDTVTPELNIFNGFQIGFSAPVGTNPTGIATGEFLRGDNLPEFAVTGAYDRTITLLVANGTNGSYRQFSSTPVPGYYPTGIVAGDFNRDGIMDVAVVSMCSTNMCLPVALPQGPGLVTIFLGDGMGGLTATPSQLTTGNIPYAIAIADLNGDGILDLAVANSGSNTLSIFMGNGDGTFTQTSASPATGNNPRAIVVGDFNQDGFPDLAVANAADNTVSILLNQNCASVAVDACSFAANGAPISVGGGPSAIASGDMNVDGFPDLIVANSSSGTVSVLLGDGTGAFTPVEPTANYPGFSTGRTPVSVAVADFNQDGRLDIVTEDRDDSAYNLMQQAVVAQLQLTTNLTTFPYGYVPTLSVQIQPGPAPAGPTGTMSLYDGSTKITSATLSGFQYQLQFLLPPAYFFGAGTHQLTAVYSGDSNFAPVSSNVVTETVAQSSTMATLASNVTNAPYGMAITLTATIQPQVPAAATGTVTFFDATTSTTIGTAAITNNSAQFTASNLSAGSHSIVATYGGDANCMGSSSSPVALTISTASTTTTMGATANPAGYGQAVTLTATVQPPTGTSASGTVNFLDGGTSLGTATVTNNTAQLNVSSLSVGPHILTAAYSGDANLNGSTSPAVAETVNQGPTTAVVTASANPTAYGQAVTFSVRVQSTASGTPTGTVTLLDGSTAIGSVALPGNGVAQFTTSSLTIGAHSISANYGGDAAFAGSTSAAITESVNQASTTTTVTSGANPSGFNQSVTFTVKVQPSSGSTPTGTVTLMDGATSIGSAALPTGRTVQFTTSILSTGSHSITATYGGDSNFSGSTSGALAQTVSAAGTTTAVSASVNPSAYGQAVTFTASVGTSFGGSPSGVVTFLDGGTQLGSASVSGGLARLTTAATGLGAGTHTITASYGGDANFAASTSTGWSQTVNATATTTALSTNLNPSTLGQTVTFTATVASGVGGTQSGTVSFYLDGSTTPAQTVALSGGAAQFSTGALSGGSHTVVATFNSSNTNFQGSTSATLAQNVKDFSMSDSPASLTVVRRDSGTTTLTVTPIAGFTGTVSLSCSGVPANTSCSLSTTQATLNGGAANATVTIHANQKAAPGSYTVTLTGVSGSISHTTSLALTIQ